MEKVELSLEKRLPELADLKAKSLFTPPEIAAIVKQRRRLELAITANRNSPADWLDYAAYELKLEQLRAIRASRLSSKGKGRHTISDYSIPAFVSALFARAVQRHPASLDIWTHYIKHCIALKQPLQTSRVLADAIAIHPNSPIFWIIAARYEAYGCLSPDGELSEHGGGNFDAARKLLLRALRFAKHDNHIWHEWLRLEVAQIEFLHRRREALGVKETTVKVDKLQGEDDDPAVHITGSQALLRGDLLQLVIANYTDACSSTSDTFTQDLVLFLTSLKSTLIATTIASLESKVAWSPTPEHAQRFMLQAKYDLQDNAFIDCIVRTCDAYDAALPQSKEMAESYAAFLDGLVDRIEEPNLKQYVIQRRQSIAML